MITKLNSVCQSQYERIEETHDPEMILLLLRQE